MTRILAVSPNEETLREITEMVGEVYAGSVVFAFSDPMLAVQHAYNNPVDVVYTEVEMKRLTGFDVLRLLRKRAPRLPVHFVCESDAYETDALRATADSYLVRPLTMDKVHHARTQEEVLW